MTPEFKPFTKIARLNRESILTEKIDGTNALIYISALKGDESLPRESLGEFILDGKLHYVLAGSRTRWIRPDDDNFAFAQWVVERFDELKKLGPGSHFGEFWGSGIQRGYGYKQGERFFSMFNVVRWCLPGSEPQLISQENPTASPRYQEVLPECCGLIPILRRGLLTTSDINDALDTLREQGSYAAGGFMNPEGVVWYHTAANTSFKVTLKNDERPKRINTTH